MPTGPTALSGPTAPSKSGSTGAPIVEVVDLVKVYPGSRGREAVRAVDGISFSVAPGEFFGFLGPNGAGKTTTIRILATLARATSGTARVAGLDPATDAAAVRARIGIALQTAAVEGLLTGRENLELAGRLHRVRGRELRARVDDLLELMNLTAAADRLAGTYSGGMRRRLDLATALVHWPEVLFLDEPTEGLDPQSRAALWEELLRINAAGTAMFLTTHYMEEADRLCSRLAIVDEGRIVVEGAPAELKRGVGADQVSVTLASGSVGPASPGSTTGPGLLGPAPLGPGTFEPGAPTDPVDAAARELAALPGVTRVERTATGLSIGAADAHLAIPAILRLLDRSGVAVEGLTMREPSLDDVFLAWCGRRIRAEEADQPIALGWM